MVVYSEEEHKRGRGSNVYFTSHIILRIDFYIPELLKRI